MSRIIAKAIEDASLSMAGSFNGAPSEGKGWLRCRFRGGATFVRGAPVQNSNWRILPQSLLGVVKSGTEFIGLKIKIGYEVNN